MRDKSFDQDKNYILKQAQIDSKDSLTEKAVPIALENYQLIHNPLKLQDDFFRSLNSTENINTSFLERSYYLLSDIYRLLFADNQLEFLWDGSSHYDQYCSDWSRQYLKWQELLGRCHPNYSKIIVKGCFLHQKQSDKILLIELDRIIMKDLKIQKTRKGQVSVAA